MTNGRAAPRIVAAYCHRYEPQWLIDELRENLAWVDGFVAIDTSDYPEPWMPRQERLPLMQEAALDMGANWILHLDPDERLQDNVERHIRRLARRQQATRYAFRMRELWTPDTYRVDGVWNRKWRRRFYRADIPLEGDPIRVNFNIYHLKMIEPENRTVRARVHSEHNTWDNKRRGFGYLAEEEGLLTRPIPPGREFTPPYRRYIYDPPI